jgi:hypothetical protein
MDPPVILARDNLYPELLTTFLIFAMDKFYPELYSLLLPKIPPAAFSLTKKLF